MATKYSLTGTSMNWSANTWGQLVADGVIDHPVTNARLTPAVSPGWGALGAAKVEINGTLYTVESNTADDLTITAVGPSDGTYSWVLFNEGPPGDGDTASLNGSTGNPVTMNIGTIPASGTLAVLQAKNTAGSFIACTLMCTMTSAIFHGDGGTINITTGYGGSHVNGLIYVNGNDDTHKITINIGTLISGTSYGIRSDSSATVIINGNITAGTGGTCHGIYNTSTGPIKVIGNINASSSVATGYGFLNNSTASVIIIGDISGANSHGFYNNSTGVVDITGDIYGGSSGTTIYGFYKVGATTISITGNISAGAGCGLRCDSTGIVTINGNITGGAGYGVYNYGATNINVTGTITTDGIQWGFINNNTGTVNVIGDCNASSTGGGFYNNNVGAVTVNGDISGAAYNGFRNVSTGFVDVTGDIFGGTATSAYGFRNTSTGSISITGNISAGSNNTAYGVYNESTGAITINNSNITGGSASRAVGIFNVSTGDITLNNCNLICGSASVPYVGTLPTWDNSSNINYTYWANTGRNNKFGTIPAAGTMATGTICGDTTGTRIDCPENKALTTSGEYGDPDDPFVGNYVPGSGGTIFGTSFNGSFN